MRVVYYLMTVELILASCGAANQASDPSAGVNDTQAAEHSTAEEPVSREIPVVKFALLDGMPASLGAVSYYTEAAFLTGITEQARGILYKSAKTDWLVTAAGANLDSVLGSPRVTFDIRSTNNSQDIKKAETTSSSRRWQVEALDVDGGTTWVVKATVKVPLINSAGNELYCAAMQFQKALTPDLKSATSIREFSMAVNSGTCSATSTPLETLTTLSAKTKIAPGDSKQAVAIVMGNQGLQVMSSTLWCWIGSSVTSACAKNSSSWSYTSPALNCDCEVRFDSAGKLQSQKGVAGSALDLSKW